MHSTSDNRNPVEELAEEFMRRRRNHENPSVDEYARAYPELASEIQLSVRERLSAHEYPREIEFIDSLPMTTTGKVRRIELRAREQQK